MSFRLLPNSMTLNDLERRNRPNGCVISPNSVAFWAMTILSVRLSVRLSVCLCVCLSNAWIVTKRQKDLSRFLPRCM